MLKFFKFRVYIFSYDFNIIKNLTNKIKLLSNSNSIKFSGPVALPIKKELFNFLRSPHVNKDSREQLYIFTYKRIIDFFNVNFNFINSLRDLFFFYSLDFNFKFILNNDRIFM